MSKMLCRGVPAVSPFDGDEEIALVRTGGIIEGVVHLFQINKSTLDCSGEIISIPQKLILISNQLSLSLHDFSLSRVDAELQQSYNDQSYPDKDTGDNGKPIQEGLIRGAICIFILGIAGDLDHYGSMKRKVCLQGLGLVLILAAPIVAIIGGYRIVHGDYGLFSVDSLAPASSSLPMFSHGRGGQHLGLPLSKATSAN